MNIMVVDDERLVMDHMLGLVKRVAPDAVAVGFTEPEDACSYLLENRVDIVFLDVEMGELGGITLAERCKELCPEINLIFVTGYSQYMKEAFRLHASGYLMKPVSEEELRDELDNLRYPLPKEQDRRVKIQTFGNFEIFLNGKPVDLPRTKCRECLAYLVDRKGARVSMPELASILWGDRPYDRKVQNSTLQVIFALMKALKQVGIQDIIIKNRRELAIDPEKVDCDYYAALNGDLEQMNAFTGEYMTNYSWAEFTLGGLSENRFSRG